MKKTLFLVMLAFLPLQPLLQTEIFSQNQQMRQRDANSQTKPAGTITGKVFDNETKKPLTRATITVHNATSNTQVSGGYTDRNGMFSLNVNNGNYYIQIKFVSYETIQRRNISITASSQTFDAGNIYLVPTSVRTKEVQVVAEREAIEVGLDRKVFNIEQDVQNLGGSAIDVLANIPSVTVDQDDNVSLRGNSNVRIMIDGRMSNLSASEALEQIPATMISSIELITNPGARYDAEGTAGIINVVTSRQRADGANAMVNLNAGTDDPLNLKLNGSISANWDIGKWNVFANFSGRHGNRSGTEINHRTMWRGDATTYLDEDDSTRMGPRFFSGKIGADYNFDKNNVLTYSLRVNQMKRIREEEQLFTAYTYDDDTTKNVYEKYEINVDNIKNIPYTFNTENALTFKHNFEQKGHELYADAFYTTFDRTGALTDYEQIDYLAPDFINKDDENILNQRNETSTRNRIFLTQVDYAVPIGTNLKIEAGGKLTNSIRDVEMIYSTLDNSNGIWDKNEYRSDDFIYTENIYALYATASSTIGKLKYQLGVRYELTTLNFDSQKEPDSSFTDNYPGWFPSVYLSYQINPSHQFNLSLSSRIRRPTHWDMNPVTNYEDPLNLSRGNKFLRPESLYAGEGGYMLNLDKTTITSTLFYRYTTKGIERYREILGGDTTLMTPQNISSALRTGFELIVMQKINDWWKADGNFTFYNTTIDATNLPEGDTRNANNWDLRLNSVMSFSKILETQLSWRYRSKRIRAQGETKPNWNLDASFKYNVSRQLSFSLRVQDIFDTRQFETYEYIPNVLYSTHKRHWYNRSYFVGMTYRFHDFKQRRERENEENRRAGENGGNGES